MIQKWKTLDSKQIFKHPRINLFEDTIEFPNGKTGQYLHFGESNGAVTIVAIKDNEILLQREYSYPPNEVLLEFPGGSINDNESPLQAAKRELAEESNLKGDIKQIGSYLTNNRRSAAKMHVFLATNTSITQGQPDSEEFIEPEWLSLQKIEDKIRSGEIQNIHTIAALHLIKLNAS